MVIHTHSPFPPAAKQLPTMLPPKSAITVSARNQPGLNNLKVAQMASTMLPLVTHMNKLVPRATPSASSPTPPVKVKTQFMPLVHVKLLSSTKKRVVVQSATQSNY